MSPIQAQLDYWRKQLAGLPTLELPTDHTRPPIQTFRGASHFLAIPETLAETLVELGQREGVTLFMILLAAFQALLARYTGQTDIVVGSPVAGRPRPETQRLVGLFINTLVLRTDLGGNPTSRELVERVRKVCSGAYAHQDLPFEKLVDELQPDRDLSRNPLFHVMLTLQNAPIAEHELAGLTLRPLDVETGAAQLDLSLFLTSSHRALVGSLEYNTDLFEPSTIARLVGHLHLLLEGMTADPSRHLMELPLLTDAERYQLLIEWNATATAYPADACVHTLFEAQAARTPDAVALVFGGQGSARQGVRSQESGVRSQESEFPAPNPQPPISNPQSAALSPQSSVLSP